MSPADEKRLEEIRNRVARFQLGKTIQQASDMRFLLDKIKELEAESLRLRGKSA